MSWGEYTWNVIALSSVFVAAWKDEMDMDRPLSYSQVLNLGIPGPGGEVEAIPITNPR